VFMEIPTDHDEGSNTKLVVGKGLGSGLKMGAVQFDLTPLILPDSDVWIYDSNLFLNLINLQPYSGVFKPQRTKIQPIHRAWSSVTTVTGQMTSEQNLKDATGEFKDINKMPKRDKLVAASFTDTIKKWINPGGNVLNEDNYGVALVNEYVDGSHDNTDAMEIRYTAYDNDTVWLAPYIDVCYKEVLREQCPDTDDITVIVPALESIVLIDDGANHNNQSLSIGTNLDGTKRRILVKFDLDDFERDYVIKAGRDTLPTTSWIKLHFISHVGGHSWELSDRNISVYQVTEAWDESSTWDTAADILHKTTPISTGTVLSGQFDGSRIVMRVDSAIEAWIDRQEPNLGLLFIDHNEDFQSRVPMFVDDDEVLPGFIGPELHFCMPAPVAASTPVSTTYPTGTSTPTTTIKINPGTGRACKVVNHKLEYINITHPTDDSVHCLSEQEIPRKMCQDLVGSCPKGTKRLQDGTMVVQCECCLPELVDYHVNFVCNDGIADFTETINIKRISECFCYDCANSRITNGTVDDTHTLLPLAARIGTTEPPTLKSATMESFSDHTGSVPTDADAMTAPPAFPTTPRPAASTTTTTPPGRVR